MSAELWFADLDSDAVWPKPESVLTPAEQERAARFRREVDRNRWVRGRSLTRVLLADRVGATPLDLPWGEGDWGKPFLTSNRAVHFNVSHSGALFAVAIGTPGAVGLDVELVRSVTDLSGLWVRICDDAERRTLAESEGLSLRAFFRVWTLKEAVMKCLGTGLHLPPRGIAIRPDQLTDPQVGVSQGGQAKSADQVIRSVAWDPWNPEIVRIRVDPLGRSVPGFEGCEVASALVCEGGLDDLTVRFWPS